MNKKCLMKNVRFNVEISIYDDLFQAAGYQDDDEGHIQLVTDLMNAKFKRFEFDGVLFDSPPCEITLVDKSDRGQCEEWEEV